MRHSPPTCQAALYWGLLRRGLQRYSWLSGRLGARRSADEANSRYLPVSYRLRCAQKTCALDEVNGAFWAMKVGEVARSVIVHGSDEGASQGYSSTGGW